MPRYRDKLFQLCGPVLIQSAYNGLDDLNFDLLAEILDFSKL